MMNFWEDPAINFAVFKRPICNNSMRGPIPMLLKYEDRVVVFTTPQDELPSDCKHITPPDAHGVRLTEIPTHYIDYVSDSDVIMQEVAA